jgi:uncharacterized membrane protein YraQ (UPF0718 family)
MDTLISLFSSTLAKVWLTFLHNWPFLILSVLVGAALKLYLDPQKVSAFLMRYRRAGVMGATAVAVGTPLCSCGTTAIILGMMSSMMPWAPIVAFMVASPLTSPQELVYSAGLFGWPFAITFFVSSILLGLLGGAVAGLFESRGWLANQSRFGAAGMPAQPVGRPAAGRLPLLERSLPVGQNPANQRLQFAGIGLGQPAAMACCVSPARDYAQPARDFAVAVAAPVALPVAAAASACGCASPAQTAASCECDSRAAQPIGPLRGMAQVRVTPKLFLKETLTLGRQLVLMFFGFAFIGYLLNGLIPAAWVSAIFGAGNRFGVLLSATLGLPLYINSEASMPLVLALIDNGMSQGAALAFLITGAGTSLGALAGALTIARWRVIAVVIGTLWVGAVVAGSAYDLLLATGLL